MKIRNPLLLFLFSAALIGAQAAPAPRGGSEATLMLENAELKVTWRTVDAAIVQVEWKPDGTRFFPEGIQAPEGIRLGLGAAAAPGFAGAARVVPTPQGQEVTFRSARGERITYRLPATGHVLELVEAAVALELLPRPTQTAQVKGLGRVFTLEPRHIHAVPWVDLVKAPWLGFLGAHPTQLPVATPRVGLDAGAGGPTAQANPAFAAIWDLSAAPVRDRAGRSGYTLGPGASGRLYLGPKSRTALVAFGEPFAQVLDFGFFGPLGQGLFWALHLLQGWCSNWGWALILFSLLVRLLLWPLNSKTILQGLRAKDLEPIQKAIQAKVRPGCDSLASKAEQQKEMMAFYQQNGHNPLGGCLPALLQMPVFLALYAMIGNVFELRHAPWLFWIQDLSAKDPTFVLPVLLGLCMVVQQAMAPPVGDPSQRRLMGFLLPAMMLFMFANLPSGLNLYYLVFNLVGMAQTAWLTRTYQPRPVVHPVGG